MKKRLLAFMCVLAILAGMVVVPASAANASGEGYEVGYAKRDINPWVALEVIEDGEPKTIGIPANRLDEDGNPIPYTDAATNIVKTKIHNPLNPDGRPIDVDIVSLGMGGYGNSAERQVACMTDDNGDGYISYGDGIYVTCTAVTDSNDKTVLYLTLDLTGVSENVTDILRNLIVERLEGAVTKDAIMINANHSHSSMNIVSAKEGTALKAYYEYMYERVADAAYAAFYDSVEATMSKGSIESSAAMDTLGYGKVVMNRVRHTKTQGYLEIKKRTSNQIPWDDDSLHHTRYDKDRLTDLILTSHSGDGPVWKVPKNTPNYTYADENLAYKFQITKTGEQVSQVDETLHVLKFDRGDKKNPVVMINWRGHSTLNGGGGANKNLSSDYANSLRYRLENNSKFTKGGQDYCVAFWQGASGNVNSGDYNGLWKTASSDSDNVDAEVKVVRATMNNDATKVIVDGEDPYDFYDQYYNAFTDAYNDNRFFYGARYGYLLAKIALVCMKDNMEECNTGAIRTKQVIYQATPQQFSYGEYKAALAWEKTANGDASNKTFPFWHDEDLNGDGVVERYILNSKFHAKSVLKDYPKIEPNKVKDGENLIPVEMQTKVPIEINAIMMGENVAIVTLPGEPFDRYSENATLADTSDNDWKDLISDTYGEPFVLGYSNDRAGYLPNALAYDYLSNLRKDLSELNVKTTFDAPGNYNDFYNVFAAGSYESNTANVMRGTGEALVAKLGEMLKTMDDPARNEKCEACNEIFDWKPLNTDTVGSEITGGHYYLTESFTMRNAPVKIINGNMKVCLDLNGKTYTNNGRIFELRESGALNIMDLSSGKEGAIIAKSGGNTRAGMIYMDGSSTLKVYSGSLQFVRDSEYLQYVGGEEVGGAGVINAQGIGTRIYLYGGEIRGGEMAKNTETTFIGATIRLAGTAELHVSGGQIVSGTLANVEGAAGKCVHVASGAKVYISDSGSIDELYFNGKNLTVTGPYTGTTNVMFAPSVGLGNNLDVGNVKNIKYLTPGTLNCLNEGYQFVVDGSDLRIYETQIASAVASIGFDSYDSLESAVSAAKTDDVIKLLKNVDTATVNKDVYLDLAGYNIGEVEVAEGVTLYCLDSETDDYEIDFDEETGVYSGFGRIAKVTGEGKVTGVEAGMIPWYDDPEYPDGYLDSYLMIDEENKGLSFHRVNLQITAMTLRPKNDGETGYNPSVYYKSAFAGDQLVAENVKQFGVAMSLVEEPTAENFGTTNLCSSFTTPFAAGPDGNSGNGTLLKNILKESNPKLGNIRNSQLPVYGRAYVLTKDNKLVFGMGVDRTFRQQVEGANQLDVWTDKSEDTKHALQQMCDTYRFMMVDWEIDNIKSMIPESEERVLKVLTLGHSLALDANHMLNLVAENQGLGDDYDEMVIGSLYYSGCPLWRHAKNLYENTPEYSLYISSTNNTEWGLHDVDRSKTSVKTISGAIDYDYWDIIIMQGGVFEIGKDDTYTDGNIQIIQNYIEKHKRNPEAKLAWNMTWCPPTDEALMSDSYKESYKYFSSDRDVMYGKITGCVQEYIVKDENYEFIIPSATVFENALASGLTEKEIHRDYVHATDLSRLMASYAFYCRIMDVDQLKDIKVDVVSTEFFKSRKASEGDWVLTNEEKNLIRETVNNALANPFAVTQPQNTEAQ